MNFWNNDKSGNAQEHLVQQFFPDNQLSPSPSPLSSSPRAVVGVSRLSYSRHLGHRRRAEYSSASSIHDHRTASSASPSFPMPPKRTTSGSPSGTPAKLAKSETKPEDFSSSVKKRLQSSTRTGQACDRCKVRKIRCDGLTNGCSPCLQNNTECRTTDRITGRAAPRGYVDSIEQQNRDQAARIRELESLLVHNGVEIKPSNVFHEPSTVPYFNGVSQHGHPSMWSAGPHSNVYATPTPSQILPSNQQETNLFRALPAFRSGCPGDNYLGVSAGNSPLSSIKGTALSILGMEIDITDFTSLDMDEPDPNSPHPSLYNKSYQAFLQTSLGVNPKLDKVKLPERDEGITYAQWFFRVINPYLPILHKGNFMALLTRVYDDPNFRPTVGQTVSIHMVFAIMFFQYAARNLEDSSQQAYLNSQSNMHYHYALGMFYDLACSHTLHDAQAMTLICSHLRNFPKPGASWMLSMTTLSFVIELGLHRSAKRWSPDNSVSAYDIEIRKRVFYSIMMINFSMSGKLGRPMPLRTEDYDIEIPEPMDDEVASEIEVNLSQRSGKCLHTVGLQGYKLLVLFLRMYSTIYAVRRSPETYIETINELEGRLREWRESLPSELVRGSLGSNAQETRVFALYVESWALEFRMLLRHPAVSLTLDANFNAESMRICLESSRQMLSVVKQLQAFKSLDTTWHHSAVFVMAITTTLFAQWEKRNETSAADLAALRVEMDEWLDIMGDTGALLGSGARLREAVRVVTDGTLGLLSRNLQSKNAAFASQASGEDLSSKSPHRRPPSNNANHNTNGFTSQNYSSSFSDSNQASNGTASNYLTSDNQLTHQSTPYPAATQYYPDPPATSSSVQYSGPDSHSYSSYSNAIPDSVEAPLLAAFAAQASQVAPNNWAPRPQSHAAIVPGNANSGSQSWQQWTSTMAGNLEPQDCYSASALMQLGGRDLTATDVGAEMTQLAGAQTGLMQAGSGEMGGAAAGGAGAWPLNIFDIGTGGSGS